MGSFLVSFFASNTLVLNHPPCLIVARLLVCINSTLSYSTMLPDYRMRWRKQRHLSFAAHIDSESSRFRVVQLVARLTVHACRLTSTPWLPCMRYPPRPWRSSTRGVFCTGQGASSPCMFWSRS
ncbi:hypothetical protein DFJ77DRAFT_249881 [Powellomyces hirtus]|nr:hypothetical protein DFJ77DRAFT_249881 [Powellomyces hirtus]